MANATSEFVSGANLKMEINHVIRDFAFLFFLMKFGIYVLEDIHETESLRETGRPGRLERSQETKQLETLFPDVVIIHILCSSSKYIQFYYFIPPRHSYLRSSFIVH